MLKKASFNCQCDNKKKKQSSQEENDKNYSKIYILYSIYNLLFLKSI